MPTIPNYWKLVLLLTDFCPNYCSKIEIFDLLQPSMFTKFRQASTVALIWSDAGAAMGNNSIEYINGMTEFLQQLSPCVRQVLWANPLPEDRWQYSSAQAIADRLNGQMFTLDQAHLQTVSRQPAKELLLP